MAKKKKDKGMLDMISGGLMLGIGSAGISKLAPPPSLPSAIILPTRFASLGAMAHMSKKTMKELHKIPKFKWGKKW